MQAFYFRAISRFEFYEGEPIKSRTIRAGKRQVKCLIGAFFYLDT